jgi:hypothetical protein
MNLFQANSTLAFFMTLKGVTVHLPPFQGLLNPLEWLQKNGPVMVALPTATPRSDQLDDVAPPVETHPEDEPIRPVRSRELGILRTEYEDMVLHHLSEASTWSFGEDGGDQ